MIYKKICIIGAGNVGITSAIDISHSTKKMVILHSSKANRMKNIFTKIDTDFNSIKEAEIEVTDNYDESMKNTDIVIVTVPSFVIKPVIKAISRYNPKIVIFIPGFGGKEFLCKELIQKGTCIVGFSRSPYICRLKDLQTVYSSTKKELSYATINEHEDIKELLSQLFWIPFKKYQNYLLITLEPSNPILHTARLYSMFKDYDFSSKFSRMIKFYGEWSDYSSEILIKMDKELNSIIGKILNIDLSAHIDIRTYYESQTEKEMTDKITKIKSWHNIDSPMIKKDNFYYIDKDSRYFLEDFRYGLCIIRGFAKIVNVETPIMDEILYWFEKISGLELFDSNGLFEGKDLINSGIPQNFGIKTCQDIEKFYSKQEK